MRLNAAASGRVGVDVHRRHWLALAGQAVVALAAASGRLAHASQYDDYVRAIISDNERAMVNLIFRGFDPNTRDTRGRPGLVAALHRGGTRVALMARLVQQLNARLFERAWQMLAPPDLVAHSCLFVMGSEGRGEQLLKTDQDNGLLLRDGYAPPQDLDAICARFSAQLQRFGYPECPGGIMLSNPQWRGTVASFGRQVREWLILPGPEGLMHLAIFLDAHAVAGDASLLATVRRDLMALALDSDAQVAHFASAVDAFAHEPGSWWERLLGRGGEGAPVHLKKAGIFPIVHGVRSLALSQRIAATGTAERIAALVDKGVLDGAQGQELLQGLHFLMGLRLQAGLAEIDLGRPVTGHVDPARLSSLERDLLKDTLAVVRRFRELLRQRLRLDAV